MQLSRGDVQGLTVTPIPVPLEYLDCYSNQNPKVIGISHINLYLNNITENA